MSVINAQKIKPYQKRIIEHYGIDAILGKKILEIGGDHTLQVSNYLIEKGASNVVSISVDPRFPQKKFGERLETLRLSVHKISELFNKQFDLVIGIAILEHIPDLDNMMKELFKVTKPGGSVILHGGPIWTSPYGHHIWVNIDGQEYHFTNKNNPIPDWFHLTNNCESMISFLVKERNLPYKHAEKISNFVYYSNAINRYGYYDIVSSVLQSNFQLINFIENTYKIPNFDVLQKLWKSKWGMQSQFHIGDLTFILKKPK